ncbi:Isoquinoline 1-oxidoreductase subunit [Litorisediminicola beolgyonensis]|uniref:Isoquinoline 1-oxidoreductase subunit n=1 Tax=Litorisediminicola beolgyonensis TaxID=1173614 RepID=A0ABW3ZFN6_9RHOB
MRGIGVIAALIAAGPAWAEMATELNGPESFESIEVEEERSVALFEEMLKVIEHPRCLNCHPVNGGPTQGDAMEPHNPPVIRGEADFGAPGMFCTTCHGTENVAFATGDGSIPGHEPWQLAPVSMGWVGLSGAEICAQLKDPERNGGKDMAALHEHMAEDGLVGWGWHPGEGRTPVPGSQELFGEVVQAWIDTGAACPSN